MLIQQVRHKYQSQHYMLINKQVTKVIPLFERMNPSAVAEFFFDQSSAHGAFAKDALNANEMNVKPGGNKRRMHATFIPDDNPNPALRGQPQDMIFPDDLPPDHEHYNFRGQAKGMKVVLEERGLWDYLCAQNGGKALFGDCAKCKLSQKARDALARSAAAQSLFDDAEDENTTPEDNQSPEKSPICCMRKVLSLQADFRAEIPRLQQIIQDAGHKCYFLPKFHCELNPIEMYWGWVKIRELRPLPTLVTAF
jgi:hypothetical protein